MVNTPAQSPHDVSLWWKRVLLGLVAVGVALATLLAADLLVRRQLDGDADTEAIKGIRLTDLITKVKSDLAAAEADRIKKGELSLFKLQDFDLEVNIVATGKADAQVVAIGNNVSIAREKVQKIHLKFVASNETRPVQFQQVDRMDKATICDGPPELCGENK